MSQRYFPKLDGVRGVAILAVLAQHFLPRENLANLLVHAGRLGVVMFFVLSGFLITGILLRDRDRSRAGLLTTAQCLRRFYIRRVLRIFPIYYLVIVAGIVVGFAPIRDYWPWHAAYVSNLLGEYSAAVSGAAAHLWSLCVEEQFYLVWPCVVLLVPARAMLPTACLMVLGSVGYKLGGAWAGLDWRATNIATPGCFDSLGLGAILALLRQQGADASPRVKRFATVSLLVGLPLTLVIQGLRFQHLEADFRQSVAYQGLVDLGFALLSVALVHFAAGNSTRWGGRVLQVAPLVYLGKISYGLYLYHLFVPALLDPALQRLGWGVPEGGYGGFLFYSTVSICAAVVSWHLIERPINGLKDRLAPPRPAFEDGTLPSSTDAGRPVA